MKLELRHFLILCSSLLALVGLAYGQALPRQSHYLEQGLQAGMSIGSVSRTGCQSRFHWQGSTEYSYNKKVSGGVAFRVFGGDIDGFNSLVYSRYFIYSRFHWRPISGMQLFVGPVLGVDNTDIQTIRDAFNGSTVEDPAPIGGQCSEAYSVNGASLGWEAGTSYALHPWVSTTLGHGFEINVEGKARVSLSPGIVLNLLPSSPRFKNNLQALWLHLEWVKSFTLNAGGSENLFQLGLSLGF